MGSRRGRVFDATPSFRASSLSFSFLLSYSINVHCMSKLSCGLPPPTASVEFISPNASRPRSSLWTLHQTSPIRKMGTRRQPYLTPHLQCCRKWQPTFQSSISPLNSPSTLVISAGAKVLLLSRCDPLLVHHAILVQLENSLAELIVLPPCPQMPRSPIFFTLGL